MNRVTKRQQADALSKAIRRNPPRLRITPGMARAAVLMSDRERWDSGYYRVPAENYVSRFQRWVAYLAWLNVGFLIGLVVS